jgi:hypothetical protein
LIRNVITVRSQAARFLRSNDAKRERFPANRKPAKNRMASQESETAALEVWPRAVMATLLLLISLLTAHLVQLTWFDEPAVAASAQHDLAQQP